MGIPTTTNPKVLAHIEAQQYDLLRRLYTCGCFRAKDDTIMLCQWHDGYDQGLADAEQETPLQRASRKVTEQQDELAEAIQWRDWQTVEMLMDDQADEAAEQGEHDKARAAHFAAIKVSQASEAICAWWDKANPTICEHCGKPPHEMAVNNEDLTELMHLISNLYAANTAHRNTTT